MTNTIESTLLISSYADEAIVDDNPLKDERNSELTNKLELIEFFNKNDRFAVPISLVSEVLKFSSVRISKVPNTKNYVLGIISLRGEIIPVLDLQERLGERQHQPNEHNRIIIFKLSDMYIGLLVDDASDILEIVESQIQKPTNVSNTITEKYILGAIRFENKVVIILDIHQILFE